MKEPTALLTRPAAQSAELAAALSGCSVVISPLIEIVPCDVGVDLDGFDLLLFASQNAVLAARRFGLAGRRAFAVGPRTAAVAAAQGMEVMVASGNADGLVAAVSGLPGAGRVLFLRGRHSRGDVAGRLARAGIDIREAVIYDQRARPLSREAVALLRGRAPVVLPLFSPRSALLMAQGAQTAGAVAPLVIVALSRAVAAAWNGPRPADVAVAGRPSAEEMVALTRARLRLRA